MEDLRILNSMLTIYLRQVTPSTAPYKPSPLSFGSPRTSPFRRPESPSSPSTIIRPSSPSSSPGKGTTPIQSPSKLNQSYFAEDNEDPTSNCPSAARTSRQPQSSPTRGAQGFSGSSSMMGVRPGGQVNGDALSKVPPAQLREMREAFQVLDRDSDGEVNRDDVVDILTNLGTNGPGFFNQF